MPLQILFNVRRQAKKLGIDGKINESTRADKRYMIELPSGKVIHFGAKNGLTFRDHHDKKKRAAWRARHSKIMKNGKPAYLDRTSPSFYSWHLLW